MKQQLKRIPKGNDMNKNSCPNEIDWAAFCYLSGELSPADAEAFEAQLAENQMAREALANAVELTQVVAAAEQQVEKTVVPLSRSRAAWSTRVSWMAVGGLASLLAAFFVSGAWGPTWQAVRQLGASSRQPELAAVWSQARSEFSSDMGPWLWQVGSVSAEADEDTMATGDSLIDSLAASDTPSWMTAAIESSATSEGADATPEPFTRERTEN
jgi:hypothetical protein